MALLYYGFCVNLTFIPWAYIVVNKHKHCTMCHTFPLLLTLYQAGIACPPVIASVATVSVGPQMLGPVSTLALETVKLLHCVEFNIDSRSIHKY